MEPAAWLHDLLLFRPVRDPARSLKATLILDHDMARRRSRPATAVELWELYDPAAADNEPVAVAGTSPVGDGSTVRLLGIAVTARQRRDEVGKRMLDELADALRAAGTLGIVTAVSSDDRERIDDLYGAGFRSSHVGEGAGADTDDEVRFEKTL